MSMDVAEIAGRRKARIRAAIAENNVNQLFEMAFPPQCACMGRQNGEPECPCLMLSSEVRKAVSAFGLRNGRIIRLRAHLLNQDTDHGK